MSDHGRPPSRRAPHESPTSSEGTPHDLDRDEVIGEAPTQAVSRDAVRRVGSLPRRSSDVSDEATTQAGVRLPRSRRPVPLPQAPGPATRPQGDRTSQPQQQSTPPRPPVDRRPPTPTGTPPPPGAGTPPPAVGIPSTSRKARGLRRVAREVAVVLTVAVVLSLLVKTFLVQPFWIPSGSMNPTLVKGDRIVVSKLTPGPLDLQRGDVVVFEDPGHWLQTPEKELGPVAQGLEFVGLYPAGDNHLVKRVIGMPGDRVVCCAKDGRLTINGTAITEPYLQPGDRPSDLKFDVRVPSGKVWVMGDHRTNSADSRYHDQGSGGRVGSVPIDDITGRAVLVVWPIGRMGGIGNHSSTFEKVTDP